MRGAQFDAAMSVWYQHTQERATQEQQVFDAARHWKHSELSGAFRQWSEKTSQSKVTKQKFHRVVSRLRMLHMTRAYDTWKDFVKRRRYARHVVQHRCHSALRTWLSLALSSWRNSTVALRIEETTRLKESIHRTMVSVGVGLNRARDRSLASLFDRRAISTKQRIFANWSRHTFVELRRGETHLVTLSSLELKQHERVRQLDKMKSQRRMEKVVSTSKLLFILESWWRRRLSSSFRMWSNVTARITREEHFMLKAIRFQHRFFLSHWYQRWWSHVVKFKSVRRVILSMQHRRRRGSTAQCVESWLRFVGRRTRLRSWYRAWIGRHRRRVKERVRFSFRHWSNETRKEAAKEAAAKVAEKVAKETAALSKRQEEQQRQQRQQKQEEQERKTTALIGAHQMAATKILKCWMATSRQSLEKRKRKAFQLLCRNVVASHRSLRAEHEAMEVRLSSSMLTRTRLQEETKNAAQRILKAKRAAQAGALQLILDRCMEPLRNAVFHWKFATIWSDLASGVHSEGGCSDTRDERAAVAHYQATIMAHVFSAWHFFVLDDIYAALSSSMLDEEADLSRRFVRLEEVVDGGGGSGTGTGMKRGRSMRDKVMHRIKSKASLNQTNSPSPSSKDIISRKKEELRETF